MLPLTGRQLARTFDSLFVAAVLDGETQGGAVVRRQVQVVVGVVAKVKQVLLAGAVAQEYPHRDGQLITVSHFVGQLHILVRTGRESQGLLPLLATLYIIGRTANGTVHHVLSDIVDVVLHLPAGHHRRFASRHSLDGFGCFRQVLGQVDGFHLIYIYSALTAVVVGKRGGSQLAGNGVPLLCTFGSTYHHVALQVCILIGRPL